MRRAATLIAALLATSWAGAQSLAGVVRMESGDPIPGSYVALMDAGWGFKGDASAGADGAFTIGAHVDQGFLVVQPPGKPAPDTPGYTYQPRIYQYNGESEVTLMLPPVVNLILEAYTPDGKRMLWEDFEKNGKYGGQFAYATNLNDEAIPMACWPLHATSLTGSDGGPREKGIPTLLVAPGTSACVSVLFWPTQGYGKLLLRADNAGEGYRLARAGESLVLNLNVELAKSAVQALIARAGSFGKGEERIGQLAVLLNSLPSDSVVAAKAADEVLVEALRLRDNLELARAQREIPSVRRGKLTVTVANPAEGEYRVAVKQLQRDFLFGVYEGSPYNAKAWQAAREGGFDYATILPAWNWTQSPKAKAGDIDRTFGLGALTDLGYRVKAHGVVWMQGHGILPDHALGAPHPRLVTDALEHQQALLDVIGEKTFLWEAMNEPANTNVPGLAIEDMKKLLSTAAANLREKDKPTLVNSPHEFSHGAKYWAYNLDGSPADPYPMTYSWFLDLVEREGGLDNIDIIGLQCYPGFHLNADWGNAQGPAYTPSHLLDTLLRYRRYHRNIHITEFSIPSSYGDDWYSGYWREPWTPERQADYAARVYTMAFAEPMVHSVTWWDIVDDKSSVITGGLIDKDGNPKPVFDRITELMREWNTPEADAVADANGAASFDLLGGEYEITVTGPDGFTHTETFHLIERWHGELTVDAAG